MNDSPQKLSRASVAQSAWVSARMKDKFLLRLNQRGSRTLLHHYRYKRDNMRLAHETLLALEAYDWPGNIRQLFNALEYAVVNADGPNILLPHLPPEVQLIFQPSPVARSPEPILVRQYYRAPRQTENEMEVITRVLAETGGNKAEAARRLGMSRTSLWKRLKPSRG